MTTRKSVTSCCGAPTPITRPWTVVRANDKRRARINLIRHMLQTLPYDDKDEGAIGETDNKILGFGPGFVGSE